jgi:hypothetical protein
LTIFIVAGMHSPPLVLGLAFSACGVWLFRKEPFAWRQLGLALIACGLFICGLSLLDDLAVGMLVFALIFLGLWATVKYPSAGIICMAAALTCFFVFLEYELFLVYEGGAAFQAARIMQTVLFAAALAFSLSVSGTARGKIGPAALLLESAAGGALLFVMLAAATWACLPSDVLFQFLNQINFVPYGVPLGILCAFAFLAFRNSCGVFSRSACAPAGLFLAVIGYFSPVSALGLILLFLAKNRGDQVLAGFAAAYLAVGISVYYYSIQFPFAQKAVIMMGSGAALLALAAVSRALLPVFAARNDPLKPEQHTR